MAGICSWGSYVPLYRLSREEIAKAWGGRPVPGEKSVSNFDEDTLTMGVEATIECLKGFDRRQIDGLCFSSTTFPFKEKQTASMVATVADLKKEIITMDCANSLRSGTIGVKWAIDVIKAGSARKVLVTAADSRLGYPNSALEQNFGDGAAALLLGDTEVAVNIEGSYSGSHVIDDLWRKEEDKFVQTWEERFNLAHGCQKVVQEAVTGAMEKYNLRPEDFSRVVIYGPDARSHAAMVRALGFNKNQIQPPLFDVMGNTGCAFPLMLLMAALEKAKPGDKILLASYGDGSDVLILQATEEIEKIRKRRRGLSEWLASKKMLPNYLKYLTLRKLIPDEPSGMPVISPPATLLYREQNSILRFHGSKCKGCGEVQIPVQRICPNCRSKDEYEEVRISDKQAKVFVSTEDTLGYGDEPSPLWAIVDVEGGGRMKIQVADAEREDVKIGTPLEMTFRKFLRRGGVPTYFWKGRLPR